MSIEIILLIVGLVFNSILTGTFIYLLRKHFIYIQKRYNGLGKALMELQKEFTQYQIDEKRVKEKNTARMEIRHDNIAKSIQKNENRIHFIKKNLPEEIKKTITHIEFAKPLDRK
jgi:uncharacterized membrane protein (DUF106 family)